MIQIAEMIQKAKAEGYGRYYSSRGEHIQE